ncbi:MAG: redoxin domain-containing protein [Planctomycetota bacterium]|jgi:peroxiredoxin
MKKYLILTIVTVMVLLLVSPVLARPESGERSRSNERRGSSGVLTPEERQKLREKWPTMTEEEREELRKQMRERMGTMRPPTGPVPPSRPSPRVFEQQIERLKQRHEETINELKEIRDLAVKEKAKKTTERLDKLINKHQKEYEENLKTLEQRRDRFEKMRRERPDRRPGAAEREAARPAPPFALKSFDGKNIRLADYRGKTVVLEWLNFECPFVKYHYDKPKTMIKLANKYKDKNVVWLAVNSTSHTTPEANKKFSEQQKLPYPILDDRSGRVGHAYGAKTTPHMYIINPRGRIVYEGAIDNSPLGKKPEGKDLINHVDKALGEITAGKMVSTKETKPYGCTVKYP